METRNVKVALETAQRWYGQGGEFKEMALSAYTEAELSPIRNEWERKILGKMVRGYFIYDSEIKKSNELPFQKEDKDLYNTEKQAKSALAYAQLTQLMALPEYNGDWVADWSEDKYKWCVYRCSLGIEVGSYSRVYFPIAFKSKEVAERFMENNLDLLKQFNEMD